MANPIIPTADTIVAEAFKKINIPSPSTADLTRAKDQLLNEVRKDIARRDNWKVLEESSVLILSSYINRYGFDADFNKALTALLYYTTTSYGTGLLQAASASQLTLAAGSTITQVQAQGAPIMITSGSYKGGFTRIIGYNATTKVADISPSISAPAVGDSYLIPSVERELPFELTNYPRFLESIGIPERWLIFNDELYLMPIPNAGPYVILLRHQLKPSKIDLSSTRMVQIYDEWENALIAGVAWKLMKTDSDEREEKAREEYEAEIEILKLDDTKRRKLV